MGPLQHVCGQRLVAILLDKRMRQPLETPQFPGVWSTIRAGLDLTTKHWWLLILPIVLDCVIWLGPHVSVAQLMQSLLSEWEASFGSLYMMDSTLFERYVELSGQVNLTGLLSVPLLGVPSLMQNVGATQTPLAVSVIAVDSAESFFAVFFALTLGGLVLGAVYFSLIVQALQTERQWGVAFGRNLLRNIGRVLLLAVALFVLLVALYIPVGIIVGIGTIFNPLIGAFVLLAGITVLMWTIVYLAFSLHAMLWRGQSLPQAVGYSLRFTQAFLPPVFVLFASMAGSLTVARWLWVSADSGNWLTLVSIFGHAFISTSLVSATFIFFRDREPFFSRFLAQVRQRPTSKSQRFV